MNIIIDEDTAAYVKLWAIMGDVSVEEAVAAILKQAAQESAARGKPQPLTDADVAALRQDEDDPLTLEELGAIIVAVRILSESLTTKGPAVDALSSGLAKLEALVEKGKYR